MKKKTTATNPTAERRKKNIALPSEEKAVDKRQRRGYSDYRHIQTAVIAVFFAGFVFNSIQFFFDAKGQMRTKPM